MDWSRLRRGVAAWTCCTTFGCGPAELEGIDFSVRDCPDSEFPAPLCHRVAEVGSFQHYQFGVLDELRDGVHPLFGALHHPQSFALLDPLDGSRVFVETPGPFPDASSQTEIATGDFDGDGVDEIAFAVDDQPWHLVVIDGATLETRAVHDFESDIEWPGIAALDVDGDARTELLTVTRDDVSHLIRSWSVRDGALVEVARATLDTDRELTGVRGDFDGDSQLDLALSMTVSSTGTAPEGPTSVLLLRGGSSDGTVLSLDTHPQPTAVVAVAAADLDGDRVDELVLMHTPSTMTTMRWTEDGLIASERVELPINALFDEESSSVNVRVGKDEGRPDWLVIGRFHAPGTESNEWFDVAVFPGRADAPAIPIERIVGDVADFNGDGLSDITIYANPDRLMMLSIGEP